MGGALVIGRAYDETEPGRRWICVCPRCGRAVYGLTREHAKATALLHHLTAPAMQPDLWNGAA